MDEGSIVEARERQESELEFVRSAYDPETEAWVESDDTVIRRLKDQQNETSFLLKFTLPRMYPIRERLIVQSCTVERANDRAAYTAASKLLSECRAIASEQTEEAILAVWQCAEDWMTDELQNFLKQTTASSTGSGEQVEDSNGDTKSIYFGRNLIYSHHIIGKQKRADMKALAADLDLTGYVKIGWPGLIIIEGLEDHCQEFYDTIRRWAWQYLVLRGEMREESSQDIDGWRKFPSFLEVDSMSIVANHCRTVGLEDLFLTSMKIHANADASPAAGVGSLTQFYGALVYVDHMNDPKQYRKWLQRSCSALDVSLLIQQCFESRPLIFVGLASPEASSIAALFKKWRSARVDVDSRGQPCLERKMTVLVEGTIDMFDGTQWEEATSYVNTTKEKLVQLVETSTKTKEWVEAVRSLVQF